MATSFLRYISNHICLAVLLLVTTNYVMNFQIGASANLMNLVYMTIALPFGYDFFVRTRSRLGIVFVVGLSIGITAVMAMSVVNALLANAPLFASPQTRQDFAESSGAIMLAYGAGAAMAGFLERVSPASFASGDGLVGIISVIVELTRPDQAKKAAEHIQAVGTIMKAITFVVLAAGALILAFKNPFR